MIKNQSTNKIQQCLLYEKSERLNLIYNYVEDIKKQIDASASAVYIIKENKVIGEWYSGYNPTTKQKIEEDSRFNIYSARKSYIGLVVAILLNDGKIKNLDDDISNYLEDIDEEISKGITIRHLVTHTHGLEFEKGNLIKYASPGTCWDYNGAGLSLLYKIIMRTTGKNVNQFIREYVLDPLEFTETGWETTNKKSLIADVFESSEDPKIRLDDDTGFERNLYVSARELAHWGFLHLNKGNINGKQYLPSRLFELTTAIQTPKEMVNTHQNGFFWFRNENSYLDSELGENLPSKSYQILGASGCTVLVIPEYKAVAVRMYNKIGNPAGYDYLRDIKDFGNLVSSILN
ncbi:serine hydrolase [Bacillus sp. EAC]|uniref:serine hydrolase domain-containing protein n=1 Tax=Bacillus sp. EAC TaxID=1978338 RepID=UPI000B43CFFD|nr:serine hydrolase domain-containing protein [Bacillus sp. EAC]